MNVTKSAPFALLTIYQKPMYPPKVGQNPLLRKIRRPFFDWTNGNGNLKFHSKLREIR